MHLHVHVLTKLLYVDDGDDLPSFSAFGFAIQRDLFSDDDSDDSNDEWVEQPENADDSNDNKSV